MNNAVVKFGSKSLLSILKDGYALIIMFICYVSGVLGGAFSLRTNDIILKKSETVYTDYLQGRLDKKFISVFLFSISEWLPYILIIFVAGLCIVGIALIPIFIFLKGFSYGILAGYIYTHSDFKGILFILILIIPCTLIVAFGLFFAAKRAGEFSVALAKNILPKSIPKSLYQYFVIYCKEFVFWIIICLVAALLDALLCGAFFETLKL